MKVVAYYRNSITKEKQKLSILMQRDHVHELANSNKLIIDEEFSDDETSARKTNTKDRPEMSKLLKEIQKGNVKTLLVYSRCRIARKVYQYMEIYRIFKEHQIQVLFAGKHEFPMLFSIEGELIERIMASFNQHEADNLVKKLRDAKITKAKGGLHAVGPINIGYEKNPLKDGDWNVVQEEAQDIKQIYNLFLSNEFKSFNQFVRLVNEKGYLYKGLQWSYGNLKNLLKNKVYIGKRTYSDNDTVITREVPHLRIISDQEWNSAQKKLQGYYREAGDNTSITFLLKDIIKCLDCKESLNTKKLKGKAVYQCNNHKDIRYEKNIIEKEIIRKANDFFEDILSPNVGVFLEKMIREDSKTYKDLELLSKKIEDEIKTKIAEQLDAILAADKAEQLSNELIGLNDQLNEVNEQYLSCKDKWYEKQATLEQLKKFHKEFKPPYEIIHAGLKEEETMSLLLDIIGVIYAVSKTEVQVIFKHPHVDALGGNETIEFI
ncbi:recombinase family protein [Rossellomorea aquimaris]|uniref:recombinase family protein n=1 Tax=Rossellomorea aquimaris TaxID=189382 RepID=UPI0016534399|nr:recombinase family protein [Rossellomorea aquimaris]